jgi:Flp pilus assembly protein TadD
LKRFVNNGVRTLGAFLLTGFLLSAQTADYDKALKLYRHTFFSAAVQTLAPIAEKNAEETELLGKSYYMLGAYHDASDAFRKAIELNPKTASCYHWLGRAYGRRAETAFPLAAPNYAIKARANLEKAVELDPSDGEALNDLFEYYLQAPGMLGGGLDKASKMADKIGKHDAAEGAYARARIAEERKDWGQAESLLRRAAELAPQQPGRLIDLAKLLSKQSRFDESDAMFTKAHEVAPTAPKVYFAQAAAYIRANRKQDQARDLLKKYLAMNTSPEDPSKTEARKLLNKVS